MKKKQLLKAGLSVLLASAMMITSVPATSQAAEVEPLAENTPILDTALANYDFSQYTANADGNLAYGDKVITLEEFGNCKKPELVEDAKRGVVLALKEQGVTDKGVEQRGDALLPSNPFAGLSIDNGFTLNFWTKTTGTPGGGKCLVDFEIAPATTGRAGTLAVNQQMVYWNVTDQRGESAYTDYNVGNLNLAKDIWKMVTMTITKDSLVFYSDGKKISYTFGGSANYEQMIKDLAGAGGICNSPSDTKVRLGASMAKYWTGAGAYIDDISFYGKALTAEEVVELYKETYVPTPLESVTISGDKTVDEDKKIQLSVTLTPADTTDDRTVTWTSSDESVLTVDENGKAFGVKGGTASVTATVAGKTSAPFAITVNGVDYTESLEEGYYLTVYSTTKDFYDSGKRRVNQETQSVYLAVSKDGKNFDVLNNNGGVAFATSGDKRIVSPKIFKDGSEFTVIAPDVTASRGYHIFTSEDGVHYYDETLEKTAADYDTTLTLKKSKFPLMYKGQNILENDDTITLGNAVKLTKAEYTTIVNALGTVVNTGFQQTFEDLTVGAKDNVLSILKQKYPSVTATYSDGSTQKFNVDWSNGAAGMDLTQPGTYTIKGEVQQTKYLNNLKRINGSTLLEDDPQNLNPDEPDHYNEATGDVYYDDTKFVEGMADPNIFYDKKTGYYYMTGSYFPQEGDDLPGETLDLSATSKDQYSRVVLRRGKTLEELQDRSKQVVIWKVGNQGYEANGSEAASGYRYIWAPEIHRVGDFWVVYFTESHSSLFDIYCHALVLEGDKDPYETALENANDESEWIDHKMSIDGSFTNPFNTSFCLDMTYFKDEANDESYVIWPGKPSIGNTSLYIAKISEEEPWKITSAATMISQPEYGWEVVAEVVNEGPTVLQKNGKIFMCYSAAGTGSEYAIGMLTAEQGEDLLDRSVWTKSPYPVLTSRDVDGEEGPGHNSFTVDKDGNNIFVYHARPTSHNYKHCGWNGKESLHYNGEPLNDPCRHARLKRVHWAADGTPILKMTYGEELTEENQTVSVKVTVPGIKLSKSSLVLEKGKDATLTAQAFGSTAAMQWESSAPGVAKVSNGKITALKAGATTITAKSGNLKQTCNVTVVGLNKTKLSIAIGENSTLKVDGAKKVSDWKSSKTSCVTVKNGKVTAKKTGTAKITVKADGVTLTCTVTVKKSPTKVTVKVNGKKKKVTLKKNKTYTIKTTLSPKGSASVLKYSSSNKKVATVDSKGKIKTKKKKGTATITVKTVNNKKATIKVTVK